MAVGIARCWHTFAIARLLGTGEQQFDDLRRVRTHRDADKNGGRTRSVTKGQHLNLLTFALGVNSLALHRHRSRTSDPPSPRAAA